MVAKPQNYDGFHDMRQEQGNTGEMESSEHVVPPPFPMDLHDGLSTGPDVDTGRIGVSADKIAKGFALQSLLVAKNDKLIFEKYYFPTKLDKDYLYVENRESGIDKPHFVMCNTKSLTSLSVARAMFLGHLGKDFDTPIINLLPKVNRKKIAKGTDRITLKHLLAMRSGIRCDCRPMYLTSTPELYLSVTEPVSPPGDYLYQDVDVNLLWMILDEVVPGGAVKFIKNDVFGPLGITNYVWPTNKNGYPYGASGVAMRPRDMMKVGIMVQSRGVWAGKQLIDPYFVEGMAPLEYQKDTFNQDFWYLWHHTETTKRRIPFSYGAGGGGQYIIVCRQHGIVIVTTAGDADYPNLLQTVAGEVLESLVK